MNKITYPVCRGSFNNWIKTNGYEHISKTISNLKLFDVSLRDGLQSINKDLQAKFTTEHKLNLYEDIIKKYNPEYIEVGSLVSPKILPILADSEDIFNKLRHQEDKNFLLVPSLVKLRTSVNIGCKNISLITSVSESFQLSNTKKTLSQTKEEIVEMMYELDNFTTKNPRIKIYLSCIDHCPIEGQIPIDKIVSEIKFYNDVCKPDIICLSDTCGNLEYENFVKILNKIKNEGIEYKKISLHLHIDSNKLENYKKIFFKALDRNIGEFDVSLLETGGCSVTMGAGKTKPNLSYELYYKFLSEYIEYKYIKSN